MDKIRIPARFHENTSGTGESYGNAEAVYAPVPDLIHFK